MLHSTGTLPSKLLIVVALLCLASMSGACVAVPSSPSQPNGAPQNAPHPEFSTTQIPADKLVAPEVVEPAAQSDCPGLYSALAQVAASPISSHRPSSLY